MYKMVMNDAAQQRYYNEIQDCVRLENLARYIQGQKNRIIDLQNSLKGKSLPKHAWVWFGVTLLLFLPAIIIWGIWIYVNLKNNKKYDLEATNSIASIEEDVNEKQIMYNELYADIEARFVKGEFSINKDCWHCGNELMQYFNENKAFSFEKALYFIDKRRDREAMERGLEKAYNEGYSSGNANGYNNGYEQGKSAGYVQGKKAGKKDGYYSGLRDGYYYSGKR